MPKAASVPSSLMGRHIQQSLIKYTKSIHCISSINHINAIHFVNTINVTNPMSTCIADELIVVFCSF